MVALLILLIIFTLLSGVLSVQIAYQSTLSLRVKQLLFLEQPYSKKLFALSKFNTWWSFSSRWFIILSPVIIIIILLFKLHHFISDLLDCPYCISFHLMWMLLFFFVGMNIIPSLVFGSLGILGVHIIHAINR